MVVFCKYVVGPHVEPQFIAVVGPPAGAVMVPVETMPFPAPLPVFASVNVNDCKNVAVTVRLRFIVIEQFVVPGQLNPGSDDVHPPNMYPADGDAESVIVVPSA
jgi:hypothetical protein